MIHFFWPEYPFKLRVRTTKQRQVQVNKTKRNTGLRGHKLKIYKPQVYLDIRKYFFSIRVIEEWNTGSLLVELIDCNTVESLRNELTATLRTGKIHQLALSFFCRVSHLGC